MRRLSLQKSAQEYCMLYTFSFCARLFFYCCQLTVLRPQVIEPCEVWNPYHVWAWWWYFASRKTTRFYFDRSIQSVHLWVWVSVEDRQSTPRSLNLQCPQGYHVSKLDARRTYKTWYQGCNPNLVLESVICCSTILNVLTRYHLGHCRFDSLFLGKY